QLGRKGREQGRTMGAELLEGRPGMAGIARGQDARPGPGGFLTEIAFVNDFDLESLAGQEIRGGQTDDAAATEKNVREFCHAVVMRGAGRSDPSLERQRGDFPALVFLAVRLVAQDQGHAFVYAVFGRLGKVRAPRAGPPGAGEFPLKAPFKKVPAASVPAGAV